MRRLTSRVFVGRSEQLESLEAALARAVDGEPGAVLVGGEAGVLALVAEGRTNRQIADALFISVKTAGAHVSSILRKMGVATRGEAAAVAVRAGLLSRGGGPVVRDRK